MIGKLLNNRYKIKEKKGSGGMALVFKAQDILLDREVAIKMLRPEFVSDEDFINKFRQEAKSVARITHPNVVSIYDIVEGEDSLYLVMEYIRGENLKSIIKKRGRLTLVKALDIANQITAGVEVAHKNNIIHCDIKPHNILITENNKVKVTDFGIARAVSTSTMTITDTVMGSAHYFSPEQAQGQEINTYSDIYSIGVVLYEMITGEVPFKGESPISVALKHIQNEPKELKEVLPSIPEKVNELIMKTLAKDPEKRHDNATDLREEIVETLKYVKSEPGFNKESKNSKKSETKILKKSEIKSKSLENKKNNAKSNRSTNNRNYYTPDKKQSSKLNKWIVWVIVIMFLFSAAAFAVIYFFKVYTEVPIVKVPDLLEKEYNEAVDIASQQGLSLQKSGEEIFHNKIEEGHIVTQEPSPGERIKQTRKIVVSISKGPKVVEVPDFNNRPLRDAQVILENLGLSQEQIEYEYSEQIRENHIISQSPEAGSQIDVNTKIKLIVSNGPSPIMVKMPSLLGVEKDKAFELIKNKGLNVGRLNYSESTRYDENLIFYQQFSAGEEVPENNEVNLGISTGLINNNNFEEHKTNIGINVVGSDKQEIKIIVKDSNGEEVVYQKVHSPGQYLNKTIYSVGPTVLEIYRDGELIKSQEIGV
ncbi:MAG: Stk1 family PASTA domain-containing Ser/Thr kinase [Halanaerobiales bacterium]|nr:Stk1 family PASTA domain-containing Ser/Thr kinase [Halanaerobiales bacterium]